MDDTMTIEDAAGYVKLGQKAFRALFDKGEVPGVSMNQKHTVFLRSDLDEWIRKTARKQSLQRQGGMPSPPQKRVIGRRKAPPDLAAAEAGAANG